MGDSGEIRFDRRGFLKGASVTLVAVVHQLAAETAPRAEPPDPGTALIRLVPGPVSFPKGRSPYVVAVPKCDLDKRVVSWLTSYLKKVLKEEPQIVGELSRVPGTEPAIILARSDEVSIEGLAVPAGSAEAFALASGDMGKHQVVVALGKEAQGLKRAVQKLVVRSRQTAAGLEFPLLNLAERPWIPEREYALCCWVPRYSPGAFVNPYADERMNVLLYGKQQRDAYIDMFDWFGFSGIQLLDVCFNFDLFGSVEGYHDRLKAFARSARQNGQHVTLWVWAAEFNHYGWSDPDITYTPGPGLTAFDDPQVRKGFEKYYDYYSEMAPYCDMLIAHFYDAGNLTDPEDVFKYMRLLEEKFRAKNPRIKMALSMWAAKADFFQQIVDHGFKDYLILEMSVPLMKPLAAFKAEREGIHVQAKRSGMKLGVWGWYDTEMETDQLPSMFVNALVLKDLYQDFKNNAASIHPLVYWSEMEAHHLNNIYSMYVASQLLWNPDLEPLALVAELAEGIWGPVNGQKVFEALRLIEDVRSGPTWQTFWFAGPQARITSDDPVRDLTRSKTVCASLSGLRVDEDFVTKFPLPFPPEVFIELMMPHLRQIQAYLEFQIELERIQVEAKQGASKGALAKRIAAAWQPIPEYNTWIGAFSQRERYMQGVLLEKLMKELGVDVPTPAWLRAQDADRLLQEMQNVQRGQRGKVTIGLADLNGFYWSEPKLKDRLQKLIDDGVVEGGEGDKYHLVNWSQYAP